MSSAPLATPGIDCEPSVRAKMRIEVRKLLAIYGYPPDLQRAAVDLVIKQAEALAAGWS